MEEYLTVAEVASVLRVSKMTVYRFCQSGELPHIKFGSSYRIPKGRFELWLQEQEANH